MRHNTRAWIIVMPAVAVLAIALALRWMARKAENCYVWMARWAKGMDIAIRLHREWQTGAELEKVAEVGPYRYAASQHFGWVTLVFSEIPTITVPWEDD